MGSSIVLLQMTSNTCYMLTGAQVRPRIRRQREHTDLRGEHLGMIMCRRCQILSCFKRAEYTLDIMRQIACLVFNPIMVESYAALFSCTAVVQASDSMAASM